MPAPRTACRRVRATAAGLFVIAALVAGGCSGGELRSTADTDSQTDPGRGGSADSTSVGAEAAVSSTTDPISGYHWSRLPLGAGGFVTGLVIHAGSGTRYARTDVGGAYRFDAATGTWQQMLLASSVPDPDPGRDDYAVEAIAVSPRDPDVVLVSVGGDENPADGAALPTTGRVLRSSDGGRIWRASAQSFFVSGNGEFRQRAERLAIDPTDPQHVLLGTRRQGLWESNDGAASFRQVGTDRVPAGVASNDAADRAGVTFVTFDPSSTGRVYAGVAGVGVLRSDDGGVTWRTVIVSRNATQVPFEGSITAGRLLVAMSTVGGEAPGSLGEYDPSTGTVSDLVPEGRSPSWAAAIDPNNPAHIVVTDEAVRTGHFWRSIDRGATWTRLAVAIDTTAISWLGRTDLAQFMSVGRLVFDPVVPGRLWFAEGMGLWRTDDFVDARAGRSEMTWQLDSRGIEELVVADVAVAPGGVPITVAADRQGFRSSSLTNYPSKPLIDARFAGGTDLDFSGRNPDVLVWIGAEYQRYANADRNARAAISRDGGVSWTELPHLDKKMFGGNVAVSATDPSNIVWLPSYFRSPFEYLEQGKGIYVTTNGGSSWKNLTVDRRNNFHRFLWWLGREALASDKVDGGVFYLQDDTKEFYVSTDGGLKWNKAPHAAPCEQANACHVFGQIVASPTVAGEVWSSVGTDGLYRSNDRGATPWQKVPGVDEVRSFGFGAPLVAGGPKAVYVYGRARGDERLGVWRSGDEGRTWLLLSHAPLGLYAGVVAVNGDPNVPGRVYVGFGGNGVVFGDAPTSP